MVLGFKQQLLSLCSGSGFRASGAASGGVPSLARFRGLLSLGIDDPSSVLLSVFFLNLSLNLKKAKAGRKAAADHVRLFGFPAAVLLVSSSSFVLFL